MGKTKRNHDDDEEGVEETVKSKPKGKPDPWTAERKKCTRCGCWLSIYNESEHCRPCQAKLARMPI